MAKTKSKLVEKSVEKPAAKVVPAKEVVETKETIETKEIVLGGEGHPSRDFRPIKK